MDLNYFKKIEHRLLCVCVVSMLLLSLISFEVAAGVIPVASAGNSGPGAYSIRSQIPIIPQITSVTQNQPTSGTFDLIINGNNFDSDAMIRKHRLTNNDGRPVFQDTLKTRTKTRIVVTENIKGTPPGTYDIMVINSDGLVSNGYCLTIFAPPAPHITSINRGQTMAGTFDLTINGNDFDSGAVVNIYRQTDGRPVVHGIIKTRTKTRIVVTESIAGTTPGAYTVRVMNFDGRQSNEVILTI